MLFYSLCCDTISLLSLKITQKFHLLLGFAENQTVFWDFKIRNSVWITEGSDNRGPTILAKHYKVQCSHFSNQVLHAYVSMDCTTTHVYAYGLHVAN